MKQFEKKLQLRWSDLDPINHVRHSVYYDFGAQVRTELFIAKGIHLEEMARRGFGPILFEEQAKFRRELRFGDDLYMNVNLIGLRKDYGRFSFLHEIRRQDEICATVQVTGAWIDLKARKLTLPPQDFITQFEDLPRHADFAWLD